MVVGRDGDALDALVLWFGGSWSCGFSGFLFCLIRTGGFSWGVCGSLGFFLSGMQGFSLFLFSWDFWIFSFLFSSWGLRGSEPWGWLWTRFPWLSVHWDFRYIMIWHTIFFLVYYGLGDGAT